MTELSSAPPCFGIALCSGGGDEQSRDKGRDQAWKKKQFRGGFRKGDRGGTWHHSSSSTTWRRFIGDFSIQMSSLTLQMLTGHTDMTSTHNGVGGQEIPLFYEPKKTLGIYRFWGHRRKLCKERRSRIQKKLWRSYKNSPLWASSSVLFLGVLVPRGPLSITGTIILLPD